MPGVSASVSISIQVQSVAQRGRLGVAKFCLRRSLAERHWKSGNFRHSERIKWQIDIDSVGYLGVGTYEGYSHHHNQSLHFHVISKYVRS